MRVSNIAKRYSQAIFEVSKSSGLVDTIYKELKVLNDSMSDKVIKEFYENPTISQQLKVNSIKKMIEKFPLSEEVKNFLMILAEKNRLSIFSEIVEEFQADTDLSNGVTRGEVVSSHLLSPDEREQIETIVSKKTNKRVILIYKEDPKLIGGLIARVDGYTFDDTLTMHLNRLNEDLKRRVH